MIGVVLVCGAMLAGCGADEPADRVPASTAATDAEPVATTAPEAAVGSKDLPYLALGDSLSRGVQPDAARASPDGYVRRLADRLRERTGKPVALVEAGCAGATTTSFIEGVKACPPDTPVPYPNSGAESSQLAWAEAWLRARGDRPTLVTLSLGANDVLACANAAADEIRRCLEEGAAAFASRVDAIVDRLDDAAGKRTVFAAMTLYDPVLGALRLGKAPLDAVDAFHAGIVDTVNPYLRERFGDAGWQVADLGAALDEGGAVQSGSSPAVRAVCDASWACTPPGDIHLNDAGYALAAELHEQEILRSLRRAYPPLRRR